MWIQGSSKIPGISEPGESQEFLAFSRLSGLSPTRGQKARKYLDMNINKVKNVPNLLSYHYHLSLFAIIAIIEEKYAGNIRDYTPQ